MFLSRFADYQDNMVLKIIFLFTFFGSDIKQNTVGWLIWALDFSVELLTFSPLNLLSTVAASVTVHQCCYFSESMALGLKILKQEALLS